MSKRLKQLKQSINFYRQEFWSVLRKLKLFIITQPEKVNHLKVKIRCRKKWYGSNYGGFYLNPDKINENSIVYSFGIGKDITFDKRIMKKHGCKVFAFDPTPKSIEYVDDSKPSSLFNFFRYGIGTTTKIEKFYLPKNKHGVSGSMEINESLDENCFVEVPMRTIKDITSEFGHSKIDVLKMDIEGSEYVVLESILKSGINIGQILVEFHDRLVNSGEYRSKNIVNLLSEKGFNIFGISASYEEVSFINNSIAQGN